MNLFSDAWSVVASTAQSTLLMFNSASSIHQLTFANLSRFHFQVMSEFDRNYDYFRVERYELGSWIQEREHHQCSKSFLAHRALAEIEQLRVLQADPKADSDAILAAFDRVQGSLMAWRCA